jgi:hypothetical protein
VPDSTTDWRDFPITVQWEELDHQVVYVRIHEDGRLEYADGYEPDEETRRMWEELAKGIISGAKK